MLCAALDAAGLGSYRVGLGDASLFRARAGARRRAEDARPLILNELATRDLVGLERELTRRRARPSCSTWRAPAAASSVLDGVPEAETLQRALRRLCADDVAERVIFDLGLVRTLGYYTGAVFEVYDAAFGSPLGGGGRYDDLLGRFGRELPACGWALDVERVHAARLEEGAMRIAVPRGAMFKETLDVLDTLGIDTSEVRSNDRKLLFEEAGHHHDAAVRRPDLRRGGRRRPRHHRQGRAGRAGRARRLRAARPRLRRRARWSSRRSRGRTPRPRRCAGWA